jgi:hypothetical protein
MAFRRFQEYLKDQKNMVEKPPVEETPDYNGPTSDAPVKPKADKMAGGSASDTKGSPKPYSAGKNAKNPNNASKGFAHEGDNDLKYEPETTVKKSTHGGEEINSWPKSDSVAEWLHKTRKLSNAKFINEMQSETCSYGTIKDAVAECANSSKGVSHLVMELKRHGLLEVFAAEICKHEATLSVVVEKLQKNPTFLRQLNEYGAMMAKYMNSEMPEDENGDMEGEEDTEGEIGDEGEMGDEDEGEMGDEDEGEMGDEDEGEGEMGDEDEDEGEMGDEDEGDEDEGDEDEMGDSALDEPINGDDDSGRRHRNHAKHALKNMGTPPGPIDSM